MKLLKTIFLTTSILSTTVSFACLNGAETKLSTGTTLYIDREGYVPYGHEFWLDLEGRDLEKLDSLYQVKPDVQYLTEKGLVLIIKGEYQKAIDLYLDIEKKNPNQYSTASNLGTAYELIGDNKNALKWIERALELNPDSHQKSEWIHVNILKIKLGQFPMSSNSLILQNFGEEDFPKTELSDIKLEELIDQMYFQLNERMSFVKPKDEIVAQLLFDYGNALLINNHKNEAKEVYERALKYGLNSPLLLKRLEFASEVESEKSSFEKMIRNHWDTALISIISIIMFVFVLNRKNKKNTTK